VIESFIAAVVLACVGALVTFGLHRLERHLERQDRAKQESDARIEKLITRHSEDIRAIARKLRMKRDHDGVLL
jgi:uncharacterized membrane protein YhiD involved in acid resistance